MMDLYCTEDGGQLSDDEVFVGDVTLKEMKQRLMYPIKYRQTIGCPDITLEENEEDKSVKIIEIHSAPNLLTKTEIMTSSDFKSESSPGLSPGILAVSDWEMKPDDTFLKLEKMVSDLNVSPNNEEDQLEIKGFFTKDFSKPKLLAESTETEQEPYLPETKMKQENQDVKVEINTDLKTPMKTHLPQHYRAVMQTPDQNVFKTPSSETKKTPIFKTPGIPVSQKKISTPSKKYQNIASPIAAYIRQSPMVPLVKDVCPKKPLTNVSSIPKLIKSVKSENKENDKVESAKKPSNLKLPSVAYRPAKETKMIDIPDDGKLPKSHWAKQVSSSIPRAMIIKHGYREVSSAKKPLQHKQEDSFANLSLHQADLSVCTQKSAFNKPKRFI